MYVCEAGFVYPDCITPFQRLIQSLGGPAGFAAILTGAFVLVWLCLSAVLMCVDLLAQTNRRRPRSFGVGTDSANSSSSRSWRTLRKRAAAAKASECAPHRSRSKGKRKRATC